MHSRRYELACDRPSPMRRSRSRRLKLGCDRKPPRTESWRWIGLACDRKPRPSLLRRAHHALHALGFASLLFFAAGLNFALHPEALAAVIGVQPSQLGFVPPQPSTSAVASGAINPADLHLLAATTWAEARSEGEPGMRAVAHVIVNRLGPRFGQDLHTVVLSPKQFSAWNLGDPNRPLALDPERYAVNGPARATWDLAQQVALQVLEGQSADPTNGALFYHTVAVHPVWARYGVGRLVIGAHVFYHNVRLPRASAPAADIASAEAAPVEVAAPSNGAAAAVTSAVAAAAPAAAPGAPIGTSAAQ